MQRIVELATQYGRYGYRRVTALLRREDFVVNHKRVERIWRQAGLEGVRFLDLRHTFASLMLLRGAKPKVISEALGHSSVAFTMDVYSHIIEGMQSDATALLDEVLLAGINGVSRTNNTNLTPTFRNLVPKHRNLASCPCSSGG